MVSTLWKACSEGDLQKVEELLKESVDIELKDHTGVTPLIEAVRNGHVEIVRALLDKGADPLNSSSQGRPEQYTSDSSILDLLSLPQTRTMPNGVPSHEPTFINDDHDDSDKRYYGPPATYTYYPTINPALSTVAEGGYYSGPPPPAANEQGGANGAGNLPPPEVARYIPCRYFPACRYGTSCLFAHPQTPYYQGPPPPTQFSGYENMGAPAYMQNYYPPPPPSFQQPNGVHPMPPLSPVPGPHLMHAHSSSEVMGPVQNHFSPNGIPPPPLPYGPMSPSGYAHPGPIPVPMPIPPLPLQPTLPSQGPQSPNMYNSNVPPAPYIVQDASGQYSQHPPPHVNYQDVDGGVKPPPVNPTPDNYNPNHIHREGMAHARRGAGRRGSFNNGRKPPCLFFPSGRCKNGDDCRFPHIIPDGPQSGAHHGSYFPGRANGPRPRGNPTSNGFATIDEKLGNLTIRDDSSRQANGPDGSSRSQSTDSGNRPRFHLGVKNNMGNNIHNKRPMAAKQQRVPNADEFPVLTGSTTPPTRSPNGVLTNGIGHHGPTAAQVLQAPPPVRKDNITEPSSRRGTPDPPEVKGDINGGSTPAAHDLSAHKLSASLKAGGTGDVSKEVSVSA